jgi:glucose-1-phosphatase
MLKIKNLILDLGGVLIDIDYQKTANAFKNMGLIQFDEMYSQFSSNKLFEKLETGRISNPDFYTALQEILPVPITETRIEAAWNAMLLHFRLKSLQALEALSSKYGLYLLSNTNSIHHTAFSKRFTEETGKPLLDGYFTKAYYSHQIGLRKPNADIYTYVLQDANLNAAETLFIDDSINNIEGAAALGIHTHHLLPNESIEILGL